jgi:hypothetical protein
MEIGAVAPRSDSRSSSAPQRRTRWRAVRKWMMGYKVERFEGPSWDPPLLKDGTECPVAATDIPPLRRGARPPEGQTHEVQKRSTRWGDLLCEDEGYVDAGYACVYLMGRLGCVLLRLGIFFRSGVFG